MSDSVDRILGILDVGIQSSTELGFGTDHDLTACSRCRNYDHEPDGDLCSGCRSFLLGDSDFDPAENPDRTGRRWALPLPRQRVVERRHPIRTDTAEGFLCVGGPLDGRLVANDGPWLRAVIPTPLSYALAATDPMAPTIETMTYSRRQVAWRGSSDDLFLASCWLLDGHDGQVVIDTLNFIAKWALIPLTMRRTALDAGATP